MTAPVARQAPPQRQARAKVVNALPFPVASLKRIRNGFDTGNLSLGQNVPALELPAAGGFLRYIELDVTGTTSANAATVVFAGDAPFSALSFIEFLPPSGDPPIVPHNGYQLALWNKYGIFSNQSPNCDPRRDPDFVATAGAGGTGGSFHYRLRLPFEIDPATGFCAITNSAANKSYLINLTVAASAAIYTTPPTTPPQVRVIGTMYYWDEPAAQTRQGTPQTPAPLGLGSFSQLRLDQPPITAGDKYIKVNNGGPVLRMLGLTLRNSSGVRIANTATTDVPQVWDYVFNTRDRWLLSDAQLLADMAEAYGYGLAYAGTNVAPTLPTVNGPMGLDDGVRFFPYFLDCGGMFPVGPRSQYQVTADATLTQVRGIVFGANVATMEILTNLIRPASAAALLPANRIS